MNYREHMKKGECLLHALLSTLPPALIFFAFCFCLRDSAVSTSSIGLIALLLLTAFGGSLFHWYRYLAYDRKAGGDAE